MLARVGRQDPPMTHLKAVDGSDRSDDAPASPLKLNLIVPFFDEREALPELLEQLNDLAERLRPRALRLEVILVDDGSRDGGDLAASAWAKANAPAFDLRLLRLSRNFGKELALTAGLGVVDGDAVVMLDADLQHPIALVDTFVDSWMGEGFDVVYAYRAEFRTEGFGKRLARRVFYSLIRSASAGAVEPAAGDFRLMSRRAYEALRAFSERERLMKGLYGLIGFPTKGVPYTPPTRTTGVSKFTPLKLWMMGVNGVMSFSVLPLRLMTMTGLALGLLAFGYGVWTIFEKLVLGIHVPGYPTLIVIISTIGAAQLIGMGVIGEYIGTVLVEVKRRPLYILQSDERLATAAAPDLAAQDLSWTA